MAKIEGKKERLKIYLLSFSETRSLNNWSSVEYSSIRSSCFCAAFANLYACSTTAQKKKKKTI